MPKWSETAKQRNQEWREERERDKARFPYALLLGHKFNIRLDAGEPGQLWMRHFGDWEDYERGDDPKHPWQESMLDFSGDVHALGHFIYALICRYNGMVERINDQAAKIEVKRLERIPDSRLRP